jgi:hypothetical protein
MPQDTLQFYDWLRTRLTQKIEKKYAEIDLSTLLSLSMAPQPSLCYSGYRYITHNLTLQVRYSSK